MIFGNALGGWRHGGASTSAYRCGKAEQNFDIQSNTFNPSCAYPASAC